MGANATFTRGYLLVRYYAAPLHHDLELVSCKSEYWKFNRQVGFDKMQLDVSKFNCTCPGLLLLGFRMQHATTHNAAREKLLALTDSFDVKIRFDVKEEKHLKVQI